MGVTNEVHLMVTLGQLETQLGGYNAAAAVRGITRDPYAHNSSMDCARSEARLHREYDFADVFAALHSRMGESRVGKGESRVDNRPDRIFGGEQRPYVAKQTLRYFTFFISSADTHRGSEHSRALVH